MYSKILFESAYPYEMDLCHSETFNISNDVKQGGVLSPVIFGIYLDELLLKLKKSGIGCHIGNIFTGALAYADDVVLLAPTKHAMSLKLSFQQLLI